MKTVIKYLLAVLYGILVGIITLIGQKYLPVNFNFLANSGAIWLSFSYLLVYLQNLQLRDAIICSSVSLIFCVLGYYVFEAIYNQHAFFYNRWMSVWLVCALIGGLLVALAVWAARNESGYRRYLGSSLLPVVFLAEGINKLLHLDEYSHMIPAIMMINVIGVLLYLLLNRQDRFNRQCLLCLGTLTLAGVIFHEILYRITM